MDEDDYGCEFNWLSDRDQYVSVAFNACETVSIALTQRTPAGIMTVFNSLNARVANIPASRRAATTAWTNSTSGCPAAIRTR